MEEYLNQQLTIKNPICYKFSASYTDSKNEKLVQLADFVANTFYRNIEKKDRDSADSVKMWMNSLWGDVLLLYRGFLHRPAKAGNVRYLLV
ncbi:DUF3800 domain-containing protein [Butyrivibrio sp. MC2013]|uniref:DUF3800 domain-containing protein n=1 Tax=Butyrivibrio sp. MC2013 TaxID=1280686 RepID=UPI00047ED13D